MQVKDIMTRNPTTIDPEAPLATAMAVMKREGIRHLPVTDDAGRLFGIITDRDLRSAAFAPALMEHLSAGAQRRARAVGQTLEELRVRDAMTWDVVTTHPEVALGHAARVLFFGRFGSLPVLDGTKLVGVLTERDLLRALSILMPDTPVDIEGFLW
ncbi:MAG TPA: CBS domain-containing protein [Methylomirabilota bacterium]|jgi:acetoin utilization protein AcuB|nr:CBS domain-containing protein [Methylomirabilota bacterium]